MAKAAGTRVDFSGTGTTDHLEASPPGANLFVVTGGSTVEVQTRALGAPDSEFTTIELPSGSTSTTSNVFLDLPSGAAYRLSVTTYSSAGWARISSQGDVPTSTY